MSYHKQGAAISKVYDYQGNLIAESNSPKYWWTFEREEPLDYIARHEPGNPEASRLYIFQGMQIEWA